MGAELHVEYASGRQPTWLEVQSILAKVGKQAQVRMVDGELVFPDEVVRADWRELRVGLPGGMLTIRREPSRDRVVCWGNAGSELVEEWEKLARALATAGNGQVVGLDEHPGGAANSHGPARTES